MAKKKTTAAPDWRSKMEMDNQLTKLNSLLMCMYGVGADWLEQVGPTHRDNLLWIASDLAQDCARLWESQQGAHHG